MENGKWAGEVEPACREGSQFSTLEFYVGFRAEFQWLFAFDGGSDKCRGLYDWVPQMVEMAWDGADKIARC